MAALSPPHQHTWRVSLDVYQRQVIIRGLGDTVLRTLRHRLARLDGAPAEASPVLVRHILEARSARWKRQ